MQRLLEEVRLRPGALLPEALVRSVEAVPAVMVLREDVLDVRGIAVEVHVLAARALDEPRGGPHADAPGIAVVRADLTVPLPGRLAGNLPEVAVAPVQGLTVGPEELRADPVRRVVVALVVAVPRALPRAHGQAGRRHRREDEGTHRAICCSLSQNGYGRPGRVP